jgi:multidrug efflux system membrane fusion protein
VKLDRVQARRLAIGRLSTIDNQIDTTTGTVRLRAGFDNADHPGLIRRCDSVVVIR